MAQPSLRNTKRDFGRLVVGHGGPISKQLDGVSVYTGSYLPVLGRVCPSHSIEAVP